MIIGETLERNERFYPDRIAITDGEKKITHKEFTNRVFKLMNGLNDINIARGDRVACLLSNVPEIMELYCGVPFGGMILVALNHRLSPKELQFQLNDSGASLLIVEKQFVDKIETIRSFLKGVKSFIIIGDRLSNYLNYEDFLSKYDPEIPFGLETKENDPAVIIYTSGTTGKPKGVVLTHKNILSQVYGNSGFLGRWACDGTDVILISFPLFHVGVAGTLAPLIMGMQNVISNFDPQTIYEVLEKEKITRWGTPPIILEMTFANGVDPHKFNLSNLNSIGVAGQPAKLSTLIKAFEVFPNPELCFTFGLGMSETFSLVNFSCITRKNLPEVIKLTESIANKIPFKTEYIPAGMSGPLPHIDLKIVDDSGKEVEPGIVGEIIVKSDNVMKGYWRDVKTTVEVMKDGWLYTGDLGMYHPDNQACHFVVGRKKDMIVSGAENIYPAEVELVIQKHPAVHSVVVFGVPDERWGETVKAAIVLKSGALVSEDEIIQFCRKHIASYKKPTSVYFVDEFPRNALGKVQKKDLAEMVIKGRLKCE